MKKRTTNRRQDEHDEARPSWRSTCDRCGFKILARTKQALLEHQVDHEIYRNALELADAVIDAVEGNDHEK